MSVDDLLDSSSLGKFPYMTFTSLGSNLGAVEQYVSRRADAAQEDDTYAWRVRKVVGLA
jgi:hypothetical protein